MSKGDETLIVGDKGSTATVGDLLRQLKYLEERVETLDARLHRIIQWTEAYPLDIFPEPNMKKARALLEAGGMTLDAVSASAMRHVLSGVRDIARGERDERL